MMIFYCQIIIISELSYQVAVTVDLQKATERYKIMSTKPFTTDEIWAIVKNISNIVKNNLKCLILFVIRVSVLIYLF
jgi:hypothetical protein